MKNINIKLWLSIGCFILCVLCGFIGFGLIYISSFREFGFMSLIGSINNVSSMHQMWCNQMLYRIGLPMSLISVICVIPIGGLVMRYNN